MPPLATPIPVAPTTDPAALLQQGMRLQQQGDVEAALALYMQVPHDHPLQCDALHLRGLLHAQRREFEAAHALIWQAITRNPNEAMFHNNLANVCVERGQLAEAETLYVRAIELDGTRLDALSNLGLLMQRTARTAEAEKLLLRAVELAPTNPDFRQNLARLYLRTDRIPQALQQCHDGLVTTPRSRVLRSLLVLGYNRQGLGELAARVLRAWIEADPDDPYPRHHLPASTGEPAPDRASDAYVRDVFDAFATSFDAKLADLSYQAPQLAAAQVAAVLGAPAKALDVLDAGCGTGLCGPLLAPFARSLTGVDLSEGMLRMAHGRGDYDALYMGELVAFLNHQAEAWDLVVSADTLCYFGALEGFAAATCRALRPGGVLVFTVEALPDGDAAAAAPGHRLHAHGRYSHARPYVLATLAAAGLADPQAAPVVLRNEGGTPVQGWLVSAQRPMGPAATDRPDAPNAPNAPDAPDAPDGQDANHGH